MINDPISRTLFKLILVGGLLVTFRPAKLAEGGAPAAAASTADRIVKIAAKKWEFEPSTITLQKGVPVVLELTSTDRHHGFSVPALGLRGDIEPGASTRLRVTPTKSGTFPFHCDVFCGEGHEEMTGQIVVTP
jgi:cytochrome c oxidase subunit 2